MSEQYAAAVAAQPSIFEYVAADVSLNGLSALVTKLERFFASALAKKSKPTKKASGGGHKKSAPKSAPEPPNDHKPHRISHIVLAVGLFLAVISTSAVASLKYNEIRRYEQGSAMPPNSTISGIDVSTLNPVETQEKIADELSSLRLTIQPSDEELPPRAYSIDQLGVSYDLQQNFLELRTQQRTGSWRERLDPKRAKSSTLTFAIDTTAIESILRQDFDDGRQAVDSEIFFDSSDAYFKSTESRSGLVADLGRLSKDVSTALYTMSNATVDLALELSEPEVNEVDLTDDVDELNSLLDIPISINSPVGTYAPNRYTKRNWISATQNGPEVEYSYNTAQINTYIDGLVETINREPESKRVVYTAGGEVLIGEGLPGYSTTNASTVKAQVVSDFTAGRSSRVTLEADRVQPGVEEVSGSDGRWIYVDLSEFRTYAYEGTKLVNSFAMSPGRPNTPTITGSFNVWLKVRRQTMSGGSGNNYYRVPNVEWIAYFKGDYALHGVYWHDLFGEAPNSAGCVGMTNEDAQWIYNFVEVGTPVIVVP